MAIEPRFAYIYAFIDMETNMCLGVETSSNPNMTDLEGWVSISVYDEEYCLKYYNWDNGKFYYDPEYTQEYISPLL